MKRSIITYLALALVAAVLSLAVFTRDGMRNVSPCEMTPGCVSANDHITGTYITTRQGFPVAYKQTQTFRPTQGARYQQVSLTQDGIHVSAIVLDILFWLGLLTMLWRIRSWVVATYRPAPVGLAAAAASQDSPASTSSRHSR